MGRKKIYTDEELKERRKEQCRKSHHKHKEKLAVYNKQWQIDNIEKCRENSNKWRRNNPEMARAVSLISGYRRNDERHNRGKGDLTARWVVDNILNKPCFYCGETGWEIMGCDRIDNSKPHTMDNVVPCCFNCNCKRGTKSFEEFLSQCA